MKQNTDALPKRFDLWEQIFVVTCPGRIWLIRQREAVLVDRLASTYHLKKCRSKTSKSYLYVALNDRRQTNRIIGDKEHYEIIFRLAG